jgi:hypothetical protein
MYTGDDILRVKSRDGCAMRKESLHLNATRTADVDSWRNRMTDAIAAVRQHADELRMLFLL